MSGKRLKPEKPAKPGNGIRVVDARDVFNGIAFDPPPPSAGVDLERLAEYARLHTDVADAAALLDLDETALQEMIDDPKDPCARVWRRGRAEGRLQVREVQFRKLEDSVTVALQLGRELLGQDGSAPRIVVVEHGMPWPPDADGERDAEWDGDA